MTDTSIPTTVAPQVLLVNYFKTLKLPTFAREYEKVGIECAREGIDYARYLLRLCELECIDRERRNTERRIRQAKFPVTKSLDTFDFAAIPGLNKSLVLELIRCEWIDKRENIMELPPLNGHIMFCLKEKKYDTKLQTCLPTGVSSADGGIGSIRQMPEAIIQGIWLPLHFDTNLVSSSRCTN